MRILAAAALLAGGGLLADGDAARAGDVNVAQGGFLLNFNAPVVSLKEARFRTILRQQYDFSCGSAAVASLLTYHYERPVTEDVVFQAMWATGNQESIQRNGFSFLDMKNFLNGQKLKAEGYQMPLAKVERLGVPVITLITVNNYRHFVVIKGFDEDEVLMGDPVFGVQIVKKELFETLYSGTVLVITNEAKRGRAHFNMARDWRVRPKAPFGAAVNRDFMQTLTTTGINPGHRF